MPFLSQPDTGAAAASFGFFERRLGFVPNLFRAQSLVPRALEAQAAIADAILFSDSCLPRAQKERILLAVASSLGSVYCVAAHHQLLVALGESTEELAHLARERDRAAIPGAERCMVEFALKLAWTPTRITAAEIARLRSAGIGDGQILETVLLTALTKFLCTQAAGLGVEPDFPPPSWQGRDPLPPAPGPIDAAAASAHPEGWLDAGAPGGGPVASFDFFQRSFGFVPRIFRAQAIRPDVVAAEAEAVRLILLTEDLLTRRQKESILLAVSARNLNTYCVAVHCEMLRALGVDEEQSDRIAVDHHDAGLSPSDVALLDFAVKLAAAPDSIGPTDARGLLRQGFGEPQALEAVVMVSLTQFLNTLQMGLGVAPDFPPRRIFDPALPAESVNRARGEMNPMEAEDLRLVEQARSGDLSAFEALVRKHHRRVYRTVLGVLGAPEDAEDTLQNVFLKVYSGLAGFRAEARFSTWLTRIAINEALMKLRGRKAAESFDDAMEQREDVIGRDLRPWEDDPETLYSRLEMKALVERELSRLPAAYRLAIVLRDIEQLSTEEAAAAMSLPVATLKTRVFRARLMLRDALAPHFQATGRGRAHA